MPIPRRLRTTAGPTVALAAALALSAFTGTASAAGNDPGNCDQRQPTVEWLRCLQQAVDRHDPQRDGRLQAVVVQREIRWTGDAGQLDPRFLEGVRQSFQRSGLVVQVRPTRTGEAGTLLMLLSGKPQVAPGSELTALSPGVFTPVGQSKVCAQPLCAQAAPPPAGQQPRKVTGDALIKQGMAAALAEPKKPPAAEPEEKGGGGLSWLLLFFAAAFLLLAGGALFVRHAARPVAATPAPGPPVRRNTPALMPSHTPPPAPHRTPPPHHRAPPPVPPPSPPPYGRPPPTPPAPHRSHHADIPPGPRTPAMVRTELRPQGYVEFGRCLHRAAWADPAVPPPPPGETVDVVQGRGVDEGLLLALPPAPADRTAPDATRHEEPS